MRKPGTTGVSTLSSNNNDKKNVQISRPAGSGSADKGYKIVCYFTNWAQYRPKTGKYLPEDIDPHLCTHIIYAFGWMKKGKLSSLEANDESVDGKIGLYERMMALKNINPDLKVLLAIGQETKLTKKFRFFWVKLNAMNSCCRWMDVRHGQIQGDVGHALRPSDLRLQRHSFPAPARIRRTRSRLGVPQRI
jgi:hypothetical protein